MKKLLLLALLQCFTMQNFAHADGIQYSEPSSEPIVLKLVSFQDMGNRFLANDATRTRLIFTKLADGLSRYEYYNSFGNYVGAGDLDAGDYEKIRLLLENADRSSGYSCAVTLKLHSNSLEIFSVQTPCAPNS